MEAIGAVLSRIVLVLLTGALLVFKVTTLEVRPPGEGMPLGASLRYLWVEYRRRLASIILSAWFWALAGAVTAACIVSVIMEGK